MVKKLVEVTKETRAQESTKPEQLQNKPQDEQVQYEIKQPRPICTCSRLQRVIIAPTESNNFTTSLTPNYICLDCRRIMYFPQVITYEPEDFIGAANATVRLYKKMEKAAERKVNNGQQ